MDKLSPNVTSCYFCPVSQKKIKELLEKSESAIDAANDFKDFLTNCQKDCKNGNIYNKCTDVPQRAIFDLLNNGGYFKTDGTILYHAIEETHDE